MKVIDVPQAAVALHAREVVLFSERALDKMLRYNLERFGPALDEDAYPAIGERRRFARRLVEWLGSTRWRPHGRSSSWPA